MEIATRKGRKKGVKGVRIQIIDLGDPEEKTFALTIHNETPKALFDIIKFMLVNMVKHKKFKMEVTQK